MACAFTFDNEATSNGTLTSPNYPGLYPRDVQCHYLFYGADNTRVHITFSYFDVDGIPPRCNEASQSDYVEFSNFNVQLMDRKMARYCGTITNLPRRTVSSDGNFFRVTFHSNHVYDSTGFEASYQFRRVEDPLASGRQAERTISAAVSRYLFLPSVYLSIICTTTATLLLLQLMRRRHM